MNDYYYDNRQAYMTSNVRNYFYIFRTSASTIKRI